MSLSDLSLRLTERPEVEPSRQKVSGKSTQVHLRLSPVRGSPFVGKVAPPPPLLAPPFVAPPFEAPPLSAPPFEAPPLVEGAAPLPLSLPPQAKVKEAERRASKGRVVRVMARTVPDGRKGDNCRARPEE